MQFTDAKLRSWPVLAALGVAMLACAHAALRQLISVPLAAALAAAVLVLWRAARPVMIWRGMRRVQHEIAAKWCPDMTDVHASWVAKPNRSFWVAVEPSPAASKQTSARQVQDDAGNGSSASAPGGQGQEDDIIGCVGIHIGGEGSPGGSYGNAMGPTDAAVFRLSTSKHARGRRVGTLLMDAAERHAANAGAARVLLETANAGAIAFYEKLGYVKLGDKQQHGGYVLVKQLPA